jgi:hypothetical protein
VKSGNEAGKPEPVGTHTSPGVSPTTAGPAMVSCQAGSTPQSTSISSAAGTWIQVVSGWQPPSGGPASTTGRTMAVRGTSITGSVASLVASARIPVRSSGGSPSLAENGASTWAEPPGSSAITGASPMATANSSKESFSTIAAPLSVHVSMPRLAMVMLCDTV